MHKVLKQRLVTAEGVSEFIIAVNIDIRGFSAFSKEVESPDVAIFVKKVYLNIVENYFSELSFFKPTGDGLLVIIPYEESNLQEVVRRTITSCFRLLQDFNSFCDDDPMITFTPPDKIGIGISRGTACRLISKRTTLDYSGRVLNLASRLMDLSRPHGIVFDSAFGKDLLESKHQELFSEASVYLKGVAETSPIHICFTKGLTVIPKTHLEPFLKEEWEEIRREFKFREILKINTDFIFDLPSDPTDSTRIAIKILHPPSGGIKGNLISILQFNEFRYRLEGGKPKISVDFAKLSERLKKIGVKQTWPVTIEIIYPKK